MGKKRSSKVLRITILIVAIPIAIAYGYLSLVPFDITHKIPEIRANIKENLYGDINATTLSIKFLPRPTIIATDFLLSSKSAPAIEAQKMSATVKLIPLIYKKVVIKELIFSGAKLFVIKRRDGSLNLNEVRIKKLLDIRLHGAKLIDSTLRFVHELPEDTFQIELKNLSAKLYKSSGGYNYIFEGIGPKRSIINVSGDANKTRGSWRLGGTISAGAVQASLFSPYLKLFDPKMNVGGIIKTDLDFSYDKKALIKGTVNYRSLEVGLPGFHLDTIKSASGFAELDLTWNKDTLSIALSDAKLKMDGFDILGSFSLSGPPEGRSIHLDISSTTGDYLKVKRLIPYKLFPKKIKERIEKFDVKTGRIRIERLKINTPINELMGHSLLKDSGSFTMDLAFEGFEFKYPNFSDTYSDIWGKLSFKGKDIKLEGFNGLYGKARIEKLDGLVTGLTGEVTYKINILSSFDLGESLDELKRLTKGKLDKLSGSGPVSLSLHLSGGGGKRLDYLGKIDFLGTTLRYAKIPIERFTSTKGSVGFEKDMLIFNNISAMSGGSNLIINGTVEGLTDPAPVYNLRLKGALESVGLNSLIKSKGGEPTTYKNLLYYDCSIKGSLDSLDINSTFDLTDIEGTYKEILIKKKGFPVLMQIEMTINGDMANIKKAIFNIGSSNMFITGKLNLKRKSYEIEIPRTRLKIKDLDNVLTALKDDEWASGLVDLTLKVKRAGRTKKVLLNGEISLADGFISSAVLKRRLEDVNFKALFKGNTANITIDNVTIGKSSASGQITISDFKKRIVEFEINSDYLNTKDLTLRADRPGAAKKKKTLAGTGRINIKEGLIGSHPFKAFKTKVVIDKDSINISPLIFSISGGLVTGKIDYIKDPASKRLYNANLLVRGVDLVTMIKELGTDKKMISGKLDINIDLFGKRGVAFKDGLGGTILLDSRRGRLWKFPVITKIFSLVNIISINNLFEAGLEYKKIKGHFNIKDGIFFTEDLLFDSTSLRMSLIGDVNYPKSSIDATLGFHPFVTIDKIINMIPLAGWLISGKDRSAITMYYEIDGPLKNPDVMAVPIKSLGKGIFGILERTMKLPGEILTPGAHGTMNEKKKKELLKEPAKRTP